ncbi:MAG: type II toxin-antitoxin system Phd/YefM family antitoxin [Gammaproteobacteria bacterium]
MHDNTAFVSVTEAKTRLLQLIRDLNEADGEVTITRAGAPAAVLLSPQRYHGLIETIEILCDDKAVRSLGRSLEQARHDQWVGEDEVFAERT